MTVETIIILVLSVLVAFLAAAAARFYIDLWECRAETEKRGDQIEEQRKDFRVLCIEKINLSEQLTAAENRADKAEAENKNLNDLLDSLLVELESEPEPEPEPEKIPEAKSGKAIPEITWTFDRLPEGLTNTYRCEDWHKIDDLTSEHYHLQQVCLTDMETGIRFFEKDGKQYLCAALATAYGITIGNGFEVTLENGEVFNIIHADYKHDITKAREDDFGDPDINYLGERTTNVIEFVYDEKIAPDIVNQRGGMFIPRFGDLYGIGGDIVKIEYLGRMWKP